MVQRYSPGDLSYPLKSCVSTDVNSAVTNSVQASYEWAQMSYEERKSLLELIGTDLQNAREQLSLDLCREVGKPITEAEGELGAVLAKFKWTFEDADLYLKERAVDSYAHPARVRRRPRGPSAVIAPFNFPLHLAHGAILPYLLAGNTVLFKPSPFASAIAESYSQSFLKYLPHGVFQLVQGSAQESWDLCTDSRVRALTFTGSVSVGKKLAKTLAEDLSKDLSLELGGKNAAIVCKDADLKLAAQAIAEAGCLTAGQRCNSTSRVLVDRTVLNAFIDCLLEALQIYKPGDPLLRETRLGPLISNASVERYSSVALEKNITWLLKLKSHDSIHNKRGYYVDPALCLWENSESARTSSLFQNEVFAPILGLVAFDSEKEAVELNNANALGLTSSVFTRSAESFEYFASRLEVGNLYANLPTTYSPSYLPFGGWKDSGNGHPGGQGFLRFTTHEQSVQIAKDSLS